MAYKFQEGNIAYIVDNARFLREVIILRVTRDFCTIRYIDSRTMIKIRTSRLYENKKEAEQSIPFSARPKSSNWEYYLLNRRIEKFKINH